MTPQKKIKKYINRKNIWLWRWINYTTPPWKEYFNCLSQTCVLKGCEMWNMKQTILEIGYTGYSCSKRIAHSAYFLRFVTPWWLTERWPRCVYLVLFRFLSCTFIFTQIQFAFIVIIPKYWRGNPLPLRTSSRPDRWLDVSWGFRPLPLYWNILEYWLNRWDNRRYKLKGHEKLLTTGSYWPLGW